MTQEADAVAMDLNIVSCQTCDQMFVESERRQTCPSCGGPPVGPYFQFVLDGAGLHQKDGAVGLAAAEAAIGPVVVGEIKERYTGEGLVREEAVAELQRRGYSAGDAETLVAIWDKGVETEPEAPSSEAPAAVKGTSSNLGDLPASDVFPITVMSYLRGGEGTEDDLRGQLADLGAEPEAAKIAVGRIMAVRVLLCELAEAGVEAQVEVAVEETPAEAPEPEGELPT